MRTRQAVRRSATPAASPPFAAPTISAVRPVVASGGSTRRMVCHPFCPAPANVRAQPRVGFVRFGFGRRACRFLAAAPCWQRLRFGSESITRPPELAACCSNCSASTPTARWLALPDSQETTAVLDFRTAVDRSDFPDERASHRHISGNDHLALRYIDTSRACLSDDASKPFDDRLPTDNRLLVGEASEPHPPLRVRRVHPHYSLSSPLATCDGPRRRPLGSCWPPLLWADCSVTRNAVCPRCWRPRAAQRRASDAAASGASRMLAPLKCPLSPSAFVYRLAWPRGRATDAEAVEERGHGEHGGHGGDRRVLGVAVTSDRRTGRAGGAVRRPPEGGRVRRASACARPTRRTAEP